MKPSQPKETKMKSIVGKSLKEMGRGQSSQESPSKRKRTVSSSVPPLSRRPRSAFPSAPTHIPQFRNAFQKSRYELLQGSKYLCGRQIMWNAFVHANFYSDMKKFIENMSWMGITNLDEKHYSPMLVNEFYSGLLLRSTELRTS